MGNPGEEIRQAAQDRYASGNPVWSPTDKWNSIKLDRIARFCRAQLSQLPADLAILNAGAGSHRYEWLPEHTVNLDRFAEQVCQLPNPVVGNLEALPFKSASFDLVICVGPVLNYTSALEAISEMSRVLKRGGRLILHYETSDSAEHLFTDRWRQNAAPLHTFNNGSPDMVWIYSRRFVGRALARNRIRIEEQRCFHIGSAILLRLGMSPGSAAFGARLDQALGPLAFLADDIILVGQKDEV